jgi:hypothetical protein
VTRAVPESDTSTRFCRRLIAASITLYLVYSSFGFDHPILWGHFGFHSAAYLTRALNTLRFGLVTPADSPGFAPPPPNTIYLHHPFAYHHLYTPLIAIFGNHAWLGAVVPALTGLGLLWALHTLVRSFWGPWQAALAVLAWVALPFVWSFSILTDAMFPAMTCSIVTTYAFMRFVENPSWRWLGIGAIATGLGGVLMWESLIQTALYGPVCLVWIIASRKARLGRVRAGWFWLVVTGVVIALTLALHVALIHAHGRLADFMESFRVRRDIQLKDALKTIGMWALVLYGPVIGALSALWMLLFLLRVVLRRVRRRDLAVFTFLVINVVYILLFPQAAAIHLYRVFWMSTSLVLMMMDLADGLYGWIVSRRQAGKTGFAPSRITAVFVTVVLLLILPQSVYDLVQSREVMGCLHNEGYDPEEEKMAFATEVRRDTIPADIVGITRSVEYRDEFFYRADRTLRDLDSISDVGKPTNLDVTVLITDATPADYRERSALTRLLGNHPARRIGQWLLIDLRRSGSELRTFVFQRRRPSLAWRWFVSHCYPPLDLVETRGDSRGDR